MDNIVRVGLVGFGWFGRQHYKVYEQMCNVRVVAICDNDLDSIYNTKSLQDEFHKDVNKNDSINFDKLKLYRNIEAMLQSENIDLVDITAIESAHYSLAKIALMRGKNVIIEKPMTIKYSDAKELLELAYGNNCYFYVGNILRFDRRYNSLNELLNKYSKEDVRHMSLERNFQTKSHYVYGRVNPVYSSCVHDIDLTLWLSKQSIKSVHAYGMHFLNREHPDAVVCVLKLENGAMSVIQNIWHINEKCPYGFEFSTKIILEGGTYCIKNEPDIMCWADDGVENPELFFWPTIEGKIKGALSEELEHYVSCAKKNIESEKLKMTEAIESIRIANALELSLAKKREVFLEEVQ